MNRRTLRDRIAEILEDAGIWNDEVIEEIATTVVKLEMEDLFDEVDEEIDENDVVF